MDQPALVAGQVEVDRVIERAEREAQHALRRCDGVDVRHSPRRLDDRNHLAAGGHGAQNPRDRLGSSAFGSIANVIPVVRSSSRSSANHSVVASLIRIASRARCASRTGTPLRDRVPRGGLVFRRDRVLEVDDDDIRARRERLVEPVRPIARHEEIGCRGPAQGCHPPFNSRNSSSLRQSGGGVHRQPAIVILRPEVHRPSIRRTACRRRGSGSHRTSVESP